jgi:DNA primase
MAEANRKKIPEQDDVDAVEFEIQDDMPEEDKDPVTGKERDPLPQELVQELEQDELEDYSEKVKSRLKQMKKVWHDERRAKESAVRERQAAEEFAKNVFEENKKLKQTLSSGERSTLILPKTLPSLSWKWRNGSTRRRTTRETLTRLLRPRQSCPMPTIGYIK